MKRIAAAALATLAFCCGASARSSAPAPETIAPAADAPSTDITRKAGTLSHKLNETNGVIHPDEDVDPAMQKTAPATGTMPVIPPPGSPGGPTDVEPK
jgi:hypothetical protein